MKRLLLIIIVAVISMTAAESIGAVITETQTFDFSLSPGQSLLTFDQFDDAGGTLLLESVTLMVDALQSADVTVQNSSKTGDGDVTLSLTGQVACTVDSLAVLATISDSDTQFIPVMPGGKDTVPTEVLFLLDDVSADSSVAVLDLSAFIGLGTLTVSVDGQGLLETIGGAGNYTVLQNSFTASGDVCIIYEYSPIPEPATFSMLALGGMAMLYIRRR